MSTNFNLAMLRNLHQPVSESLEAAIVQLSQYSAGTMDPSTFSGAHHAHLVNGSLSVIGCRAAAKVASLLEDAMSALPVPQTRGWDEPHAVEIAKLCQVLASQLLDHINRILADMEDLSVRMWPVYRDLHQQMGSSVEATAEDLYEPDPNFQNLKFAPLAQDYLSSVVRGAISRLRESIERVEKSSSKQELESGLQGALKVFDWVYSLRHARGYQAYWLVLSARLSMGLLDPEILGDKGPWSVLLGEALIELEKFARNNRRVDPELLGKTIRPLVSRWPEHWVQSHPTLAETNERLGISLFWNTLDDVQSVQGAEPDLPNTDMPAILEQLKLAWGRYVVAEGSSPEQVLLQSMGTFRNAYPDAVLAQAGVDGLMNSVMGSLENLPPPGDVSDEISVEFAAAVLLLEDALEGRGRQATVSDSQTSLQRRRLHASLSSASGPMGPLPRLRWDDKKHERQLRAATSAAFSQVQRDISEIEESLVERLRDDHVSLDMAAIARRANQAAQVLELLDAKPAATIATALVGLVERVDRNPGKDLGQAVTLGVAALDTFLSARQAGDGEANHLLAEAYQSITGEPLPYGYATEVDTDEVKRAAQDLIDRSSKDVDPEIEPMGEPPQPSGQSADTDLPTPAAHAKASAATDLPRFNPAALVQGVGVSRTGQPMEAFFLEEMENVLAEIAMQRGVLASNAADTEARQTLRRQFHTIKGSSRIAGFDPIGHAAERLERYLDRALLDRTHHTDIDDAVVSRSVVDMNRWFSALSGNEATWVDAALIDAWFAGAQEEGGSLDEDEDGHDADSPAEVDPDMPDADASLLPIDLDAPHDDIEIVAISGYGSMEYEAYYCMTEDLQKSLGTLDDLASASSEDALIMEYVEGSLRGVMDIGESMGAPALARLPRAMLENAQASMSRTGLSSVKVFATDILSSAAAELGKVIRSLSEDRKMESVDVDLLHNLQSNTDFLRAGASVRETADAQGGPADAAVAAAEVLTSHQVDDDQARGRENIDESPSDEDLTGSGATPDLESDLPASIDDGYQSSADEPLGEDSPGRKTDPDETSGFSDTAGEMALPADHEATPAESAHDTVDVDAAESDVYDGVDIQVEDIDGPQNEDQEAGDGVWLDIPVPADVASPDVGPEAGGGDLSDEAMSTDDDTTENDEEDALWDEVFDNFEQISTSLRKIGPLLASLSERRK